MRQNKAKKDERPPSAKHFGPWDKIAPYAVVSLVSVVFGLAVLAVLVWQADKLTALGLTGYVYYVVLVLLGLAVAVVLFKVCHSYAHYRGEQLGGILELGGPIVGFALVVIGGFVLVPPNSQTFPLTVYVHGEAGRQDMVVKNTGIVILDLGGDRRLEPIGDRGQAVFPAIPSQYRRQPVPVSVEARGFELANPGAQPRLEGSSLYVAVKRLAGRIAGHVQDEAGKSIPDAVVSVAGMSGKTDASGYFELSVPGDRIMPELSVQVDAAGYATWRSMVVPGANDLTAILKR
ncbi:MAG: carboxypeptidase-like regulatory domain-containing protein [Phycisphaerae bacterium]|nr:carboxypeptidase-like regulatory domain-containing protein [Phycisphaerae bacterium]